MSETGQPTNKTDETINPSTQEQKVKVQNPIESFTQEQKVKVQQLLGNSSSALEIAHSLELDGMPEQTTLDAIIKRIATIASNKNVSIDELLTSLPTIDQIRQIDNKVNDDDYTNVRPLPFANNSFIDRFIKQLLQNRKDSLQPKTLPLDSPQSRS